MLPNPTLPYIPSQSCPTGWEMYLRTYSLALKSRIKLSISLTALIFKLEVIFLFFFSSLWALSCLSLVILLLYSSLQSKWFLRFRKVICNLDSTCTSSVWNLMISLLLSRMCVNTSSRTVMNTIDSLVKDPVVRH